MEKSFLVMPEGTRWIIVKAASAEMAYRSECCWLKPSTKIAVMDVETGLATVFTRENDKCGNLIDVHRLGGNLLEETCK